MSLRFPRWVKAALRAPLIVVGVLALLIEEILWDWLGRLMAVLARWRPVAEIEAFIRRLPPYLAMVLFVLPWAVVLPLKLLGLWLVALGQVKIGAALFTGSELVGAAILARLYTLCRPALHRLGWFVRLEAVVLGWLGWAHRLLDRVPLWRRLRQLAHAPLAGLRLLLAHKWLRIFQPAKRA